MFQSSPYSQKLIPIEIYIRIIFSLKYVYLQQSIPLSLDECVLNINIGKQNGDTRDIV